MKAQQYEGFMGRVHRTMEEKQRIVAEVKTRREKGESLNSISASLGINETSLAQWAKMFGVQPKRVRKPSEPKKIPIPEVIAPVRIGSVFAFYGPAEEVARVVRSLQ